MGVESVERGKQGLYKPFQVTYELHLLHGYIYRYIDIYISTTDLLSNSLDSQLSNININISRFNK